MTGYEFAARLASELGVPALTDDEADLILNLAGTAARASERLAAPLCAYLAGRSGRPIDEVELLVSDIAPGT